MRLLRLLALAIVGAAGATAAIACSDDKPSVEEARANLCADLDAFRISYQNLRSLTGESTLAELESARDDARDAWGDVEDSEEAVQDANIEALETAYTDLDAAIADIDSDDALAAALGSIGAEVAAVEAAWDEVYATAGCVSGPTRPAATVGVTEIPPPDSGPDAN